LFISQVTVDVLANDQWRRPACSADGSKNDINAHAEQMIVNQEQTRTTANTSMISVIFDT
jgi:hypothetical protein